MRHPWTTYVLFCLVSVLCISPCAGAGAGLRVNEAASRVGLHNGQAEIALAVENATGRAVPARVSLEWLDTENNVRASTERVLSIRPGRSTASVSLPWPFQHNTVEPSSVLWDRLRYRIHPEAAAPPRVEAGEGIISLSGIMPDLFELRTVAPEYARTGTRYPLRVRALHPIALHPIAGVRVRAEVKLQLKQGNARLQAAGTTDSNGYAMLSFDLPRAIEGGDDEIKVTARRGHFLQETTHEWRLDPRIYIIIGSDKPLYQPGQILHVRALVLDPARRAMADTATTLHILDPEDTVVFRMPLKTSRFGIISADWPIPDNLRLGDYTIKVGLGDGTDEDARAQQTVKISRYELPSFTVNVQPDRLYYLPDQHAEVEVRADYLFGQPVTRGRVRVVREMERRWNYHEQKWETMEEETYQSETDSSGHFVARIDLAEAHQALAKEDYSRFHDLQYAAYFTDATTRRTEQRRFNVRVTKEIIHVYIIRITYDHAAGLPLEFYMSTSYADGTPAPCQVSIYQSRASTDIASATGQEWLRTIKTNRYGVAKVSGLSLPTPADPNRGFVLGFAARDGRGATGHHEESFHYSSHPQVRVDTSKTLYRAGEPIEVRITASEPNQTVVVDVMRDWKVIRSQVVHLRAGQATVHLPYSTEFKNEVTIAAYADGGPDFSRFTLPFGLRTVLYPHDQELKLDVQPSQATYRPGDQARVNVRVRAPDGRTVESALGVLVVDKAVQERARTDQEFGRGDGFYDGFQSLWGNHEALAGVTRRDLYRLDLAQPVPEDLQLLAEILLRYSEYFPAFSSNLSDSKRNLHRAFAATLQRQLKPIKEALDRRYADKAEYPADEPALRRLLAELGIDFDQVRDPWGMPYRAAFSVQRDKQQLEIVSAGADKRLDTEDDFVALSMAWPYFRPHAEAIQHAVAQAVDTPMILDQSSPPAAKPILSSGVTGAISGTITDRTGQALPAATVKATHAETLVHYETTSDDMGRYTLRNLPAGLYEVRFELPGFQPLVIANTPVRSSSVTKLDASLQVGTVEECVIVSAEVPLMARTMQALLVPKPSATERALLSTPRLREDFPETLLWEPSLETDRYGRVQLKFKLADNITTWKLAIIASTVDGQIGTAEKELRAFQPFFVEHDPPRVLTAGDQIALPIVLHNYLDKPQAVDLEIKPESWFEVLGPARQRAQVAAGHSARATFDLRAVAPIKAGKQRVTVIGSQASDAIEKTVSVHPDGEEVAQTLGQVFDDSATFDVIIPEYAMAGTARAELKIYPNLMAHAFEGIEGLLQRPYGCAEQTISSTYPNLIVLRYLQHVSEGAPPAAQKARRYTQAGYERLLGYHAGNGGFSYWGRGEADIALTAYALRFLKEAGEFVTVDEAVVSRARDWLVRQQRADGSWPARNWQGHEDEHRTALNTAFIARVLAATNTNTSYTALTRALDYLAGRVDEMDEPYMLASYVLAALDAGESARIGRALERLRALARDEAGATYWDVKGATPFHGWGLAGRIETTALALRAFVRTRKLSRSAEPAIDTLVNCALFFLLRHKDRYGAWHSTQATVNVLDALMAAGDAIGAQTNASGPADIVINGRHVTSVTMPGDSRSSEPLTVDLSTFLSPGANRIEIRRAAGHAQATAQLVATYYIPWPKSAATGGENAGAKASSGLRLAIHFDKRDAKIGDEVTCTVEVERTDARGYGMMLAEIGLPPGADVDRASLNAAMNASGWDLNRYDVLPDRLIVYLWPRAGGTRFQFKFRPRFGLTAKSAPSILYDYYNPEARAVVAPIEFVVKPM